MTAAKDVRSPTEFLNGLRAIACIWVICFHILFFSFLKYAPDHFDDWIPSALAPHARIFLQGHFGVDIFFILSGFLHGSSIFHELSTSGKIDLKRYFLKRGIRIYPLLLLATAVAFVLKFPFRENWWRNLLFINNQITYSERFIGHTWSLAIEVHFYLVIPFIAQFLHKLPQKGQKIAVLSIMVLLMAYRYIISINTGLSLPLPVVPVIDREKFTNYFDYSYSSTLSRSDILFLGVFLALYVRTNKPNPKTSSSLISGFLLAFGVFLISAITIINPFEGEWEINFGYLYMTLMRPILALGVCCIFYAFMYHSESIPVKLASPILVNPVTNFIAQISYGIYLVHYLLIVVMYTGAKKVPEASSLLELVAYLTVVVLISSVISWFLNNFVEKPSIRFVDAATAPKVAVKKD